MEITFKGSGVVWNASKGKALCRFTDGSYTTENHDEIETLRKNYESISDLKEYDKKRDAVKRSTKSRAKAAETKPEIVIEEKEPIAEKVVAAKKPRSRK